MKIVLVKSEISVRTINDFIFYLVWSCEVPPDFVKASSRISCTWKSAKLGTGKLRKTGN
jgi:hypothetical protein